jgi:broad specificity phosphatase PhoE
MELPASLYCSPLIRCVQTVEPFLRATGLEPIEDQRLAEVFVGTWEGEPFEDILDSDEEIARRFHAREPLWTLAPGGEPGREFRDRVVEAVEDAVAATPRGDIYFMVHGGVINAYLMHVLGIGDRDMFFLPENTSLNRVSIDGEQRVIQFINDVRHLTGPRGHPAPRRVVDRG